MSTPCIQRYEGFAYDYDAILRYAGAGDGQRDLVDRVIAELDGAFCYHICYRVYPLSFTSSGLDMGFCQTDSVDLSRFLQGHSHVLVLGATVGLATDRAVLRYGKTQPSLAVMADAVGVERIETMLDAFCRQTTGSVARFSPGYGDLPLSVQKDIFAALPLYKIGMSLGEQLLITPTKSVTAFVGVDEENL